MGMAKSSTGAKRDTAEEKPDLAEGLRAPPSARAPTSKKPSAVEAQVLPDRTPQVTVNHFIRGTRDPILRAFAHQESLTSGTRKLTRKQWEKAFEDFKGVSR